VAARNEDDVRAFVEEVGDWDTEPLDCTTDEARQPATQQLLEVN
jgi:hypothetical protein